MKSPLHRSYVALVVIQCRVGIGKSFSLSIVEVEKKPK